jgi:hypothetical protein
VSPTGEKVFLLSCSTSKDSDVNYRIITVGWTGPATAGTTNLTDVFGLNLAVVDGDGTGMAANFEGVLPSATTLTVTLTSDAARGGTLRGHMEATWERASPVTNGSRQDVTDRPGAMSANFNLPIP